jgi:hypothetical protein
MLQWWWAYTTYHRGARLITADERTAEWLAHPTPGAAQRPAP